MGASKLEGIPKLVDFKKALETVATPVTSKSGGRKFKIQGQECSLLEIIQKFEELSKTAQPQDRGDLQNILNKIKELEKQKVSLSLGAAVASFFSQKICAKSLARIQNQHHLVTIESLGLDLYDTSEQANILKFFENTNDCTPLIPIVTSTTHGSSRTRLIKEQVEKNLKDKDLLKSFIEQLEAAKNGAQQNPQQKI